MKRLRMPPAKVDPLRRERLEHLLRVAEAFERAGRSIPGHVRRELVFLSDLWGRHRIPAQVLEARNVLQPAAAARGFRG